MEKVKRSKQSLAVALILIFMLGDDQPNEDKQKLKLDGSTLIDNFKGPSAFQALVNIEHNKL